MQLTYCCALLLSSCAQSNAVAALQWHSCQCHSWAVTCLTVLPVSTAGSDSATRDVITDFNHAQGDKVDISAIDANEVLAGDQAFQFIGTVGFGSNSTGKLRFDAANHLLLGSTDADSDAEFSMLLSGINSMTGANFIL